MTQHREALRDGTIFTGAFQLPATGSESDGAEPGPFPAPQLVECVVGRLVGGKVDHELLCIQTREFLGFLGSTTARRRLGAAFAASGEAAVGAGRGGW